MFIAADIQKRSLKRQQGQLQYLEILKSNGLQSATAKLKAIETKAAKDDKTYQTANKNDSTKSAATPNTDALASNVAYVTLQAKQTEYDLEKESIESQLKLIDAQITSMDKLVQNNISQDCTLWCVGGSS